MTLLDITSSKRKAETFTLLFGLRPAEYHLREIARRSHLAPRTVQSELSALCKAGLVTSRKDGNRRYYRANLASPVYPDLRNIVIKTTGVVSVLASALQHPGIEFAFVFGSVASGEAAPESDLDLMVIGDVGLRELARLLTGVADAVGREVNPHVMSKDELQNRKRSEDHFVSSVLRSPRIFVIGSEHEFAELGK